MSAAMAALPWPSAAVSPSAEPVQQFAVQLMDLKADGRYSVVYTSNAFDTTGEAPPALTDASLRLAQGHDDQDGSSLRPDRLCDVPSSAGSAPEAVAKGTTFERAVSALPDRVRTHRTAAPARRSARSCPPVAARSSAGARRHRRPPGSARLIDALGLLADSPGRPWYWLCLSKPTSKGAIAGIGVLAHYDASDAERRAPGVVHAAATVLRSSFDDPHRTAGTAMHRLRRSTSASGARELASRQDLTGRTARGPRRWATTAAPLRPGARPRRLAVTGFRAHRRPGALPALGPEALRMQI